MNLIDTLLRASDGATVDRMAERAGVSRDDARAVLDAVVPELARGVERNTLSRGGLADIVDALGSGHHEAYLDDPDRAGSEAARHDGNAILGHMLGSKHRSRVIAARAARETSVDAERIKRMLPEIAAISMGGLSRQTLGPLGEIFSQLPGGAGAGASARTGTRDGMPEQRPLPVPGEAAGRGGGQADWQTGPTDTGSPFPDQAPAPRRNNTTGGDFADQSPLPVPGGAPGGDWGSSDSRRQRRPGYKDLSDILRRRGGSVPGSGGSAQGGGSLWGIVRQIIASTLGFKNGGVMSWIIRLILFRVLWPMLKRMVLGR